MNHLEALGLYLDAMPGGSDPNELIATRVSVRNTSPAAAPTRPEADIEFVCATVADGGEDHQQDRWGKHRDRPEQAGV